MRCCLYPAFRKDFAFISRISYTGFGRWGWEMDVMWPLYNETNTQNENNNSIVLLLTLRNVSFVLTGDSEEDVWTEISDQLPNNSKFFKIPHHGSVNGTFNNAGNALWLNNLPQDTKYGISSHVRPFNHPDPRVINLFNNQNKPLFRTDLHYHVTFKTDGINVEVKYSHV